MSDADVLVRVEHVSKKFCRNLRRSLWYGIQDLGNELVGRERIHDVLRIDEFWAIDDVSFEVKRGECLGLIGHNGAGKTTLLRMLNGLITPDRGLVKMRGRVGALIALGAGFNPVLSGRENVYVNAAVLGLSRAETERRFDEIVDFSGLREFIDSPVQQYSSGMQMRLGFSVAAHLEPDVLLVDEALAVGDLAFVIKCVNRIADLRRQGTAVIFVSHNELQIREVTQQCIMLRKGSIYQHGATNDVLGSAGQDGLEQACTDFGFSLDGPIKLRTLNKGSTCPRVGEPWTMVIQADSTIAIGSVEFELRFWDSAGHLVNTISTTNCQTLLDVAEGPNEIEVCIAQVTLPPGRFRIAAGFRRDGKVLGWVRDLENIEIAPPSSPWAGTGLTMQEATISRTDSFQTPTSRSYGAIK